MAAVTWAVFEISKELGAVKLGYEGDDAGDAMLELMRSFPQYAGYDFLDWLKGHPVRAWRIISGFFTPSELDSLKESYLSFIHNYAKEIGEYRIEETDLVIRRIEDDES